MKLDLKQYNVPERLLQIFLSNYQRGSDAARRQNKIEGDFEEGVAKPINLSASFFSDIGPAYTYDVEDKNQNENKPPAYIKITKIPKYGDLVVKKFGKQVVLNVGDIVEVKIFKDFTYDQGKKACNRDNMDKCQDSFSYVTMSEWVGKGPTQQSVISINPVSRDIAIAAGLSADPLKSAAGEAQQLTAETADVKSGQCNAKYPTGTVVGLGVAILCLMAPLAIVFNHIKKINDAVSASEKKTSELPESPSAYNSTDQLRRDPMQERNSLRPLRKESEEVKPEAGKEDN